MTRIREMLRFGEPVSTWARWAIGGIAAVVFVGGLWWHQPSLLGVGAVVLVAYLWASWPDPVKGPTAQHSTERRPRARQSSEADERHQPPAKRLPGHPEFAELPQSADALVDEMLAMGRYALLLRPQMNCHLDREHIVRAVRHF